MPDSQTIQQSLLGAARMMIGKADGLRRMDFSIDGFWDSFYAMVLAAPPLLISWIAAANDSLDVPGATGSVGYVTFANGIIEIAAWVLPIILLGFALNKTIIADRFIPYVVATNWASVIVAWYMLPISLLRLFAPQAQDLTTTLSLAAFIATMIFVWRLTNVVIGKGAAIASGVFAGMFAASVASVYLFANLLGITA